MANPKLMVLIASTRPGRVGGAVARWFHGAAQGHGGFDASLVDLAELDLPVLDEPHHPRQRKYTQEHTKRWGAMVEAADAYALVTPEYNFGPTPALLNALNYLYLEWNYKPVGFVSYGGMSGGIRAVQVTKLTITALKMMPIVEAVALPNVFQHITESPEAPEGKNFTATEQHHKSAGAMLDELLKWAAALKPMRA